MHGRRQIWVKIWAGSEGHQVRHSYPAAPSATTTIGSMLAQMGKAAARGVQQRGLRKLQNQ